MSPAFLFHFGVAMLSIYHNHTPARGSPPMLEMGVGWPAWVGERIASSPQKNLNAYKERDALGMSTQSPGVFVSPGIGLTSWTPWTYPHMQSLWL